MTARPQYGSGGRIRARLSAVLVLALWLGVGTAAAGPSPSPNVVSPLRLVGEGRAVLTTTLDGTRMELPLRVPMDMSAADAAAAKVTVSRKDRPQAAQEGVPVEMPGSQVAADGGAAQHPAGVSRPGSIVTVAGGYCDGYPAAEASLSPTRVSYVDGRLTWVDNDASWVPSDGGQFLGQANSPTSGTFSTPFLGKHTRGSFLVRQVDGARVRTIGPLLEPEDGPILRQDHFTSYLSDAQPGAPGELLVNINHNRFARSGEGPGSGPSRIESWSANGRRLLIGGETFVGTRYGDPRYGDGDPVDRTALGVVQGFVRDRLGNVIIADGLGQARGLVRVRYANLSKQPVTLYRGTPSELVVAPRTIRVIAGRPTPEATGGILAAAAGPAGLAPALEAAFSFLPRLRVQNDLLYLLDVNRVAGLSNGAGGVVIRAINLGMSAQAGPLSTAHVNGVDVPNGFVGSLAGATPPTGNSSGDGGPARAAQFAVNTDDFYGDFEVARNGDLFVAEPLGNRVRRVDEGGFISTVAGDGVAGYGGDGGPGTQARLWTPTGIAMAPDGSMVIADLLNGRIRRLDVDGTISTIAGRGPTPCGEGQLATGTTKYAGATFGLLRGMTTDQRGNLFAADGAFNIVRRIAPDGRITAQIGVPMPCVVNDDFQHDSCPLLGEQSGDGGEFRSASLAEPHHLTTDTYDNLYISDFDRVRYVNLQNRPVSVHGRTVAPQSIVTLRQLPGRTVGVNVAVQGRPVFSGEVPLPLGDVATDKLGNLYIADPSLHRIYRLDNCGNFGVFAGTGKPSRTGSSADGGTDADYRDGDLGSNANINPSALAYDRTRNALLMVDTFGGDQRGGLRVRAISLSGKRQRILGRLIEPLHIDTIAGTGVGGSFGDGGQAYHASIAGVSTLGVGPDGRIYLTESKDARVRVILPDGRIGNIAGPWPERQQDLSDYHWGDTGDGGSAQQAWMLLWGKTSDHNNYPGGMGFLTVDGHGNVFVADHTSARVRKIIRPDLAPVRFGNPQAAPDELALPRTFAELQALPQISVSTVRPRVDAAAEYITAGKGLDHGCAVWRREPLRRSDDDPTLNVGPASGTGTADRDSGPRGAPSAFGGGECQLAAASGADGLRLVTAAPVEGTQAAPATGTAEHSSKAMLVAASTDGGAFWQRSAVPLPDARGGGEAGYPMLGGPLAGSPLSGVAGAARFSLVYPTVDGQLRLLVSADGLLWQPHGAVEAPGAFRVSPAVSGKGVSAVAFLSGTDTATRVNVATSTGGAPWQSAMLAGLDLPPALVSRPSVAIDDAGSVYVAWSDDRQVFATVRPARSESWARPRSVAQTQVGLLPSLVAGSAGRAAVAYLGSSSPGVVHGDAAQADWYPVVTHLRVGKDQVLRPVSTAKASRKAIAFGPLCLQASCSAQGIGPISAADLAPVAAADARGVVTLAFATQSGPREIVGMRVSLTRTCRGESLRGAPLPDTCERRSAAATFPVVNSTVPTVPAPVLPALLACSPLPPAFAMAPVTPASERQAGVPQQQQELARPVPQADRLEVPVVSVPLIPQAPVQAALPPQAGTAPATQVNQAQAQQQQPGTQTQVGQQLGMATTPEQERSAAKASAYSYSRSPQLPVTVLLWLETLAMAGAVGAAAHVRRRAAGSPCRVGVRSGRTRR
jgi:hypothetical protein